MRPFPISVLCMYLLCSATGVQGQGRAVAPPKTPVNRVYSPAVDAGDYVYVSGQGPRGPDGNLPENFAAQCRQALENIRSIIEAAGLSLEHVVYTQVYLEDTGKYPEVKRVFAKYFGESPPARAVLGVARLPDPPIEISAIAVRDLAGKRPVYPADCKSNDSGSPGMLTHNRLFVGGMLGSDCESGKLVDDPRAQVDLALDRMQEIVKAAGLEMANMVFVNPYLTADIPMRVMNERYARRFEFGNTPARATIEVTSLPGGAHIVYTGVAVRDIKQRRAIRPKNMAPSPTASPCVFAGNTLFCSAKSGFIPGPHGGEYATTTAHQLRQTMRNLLDNLEEADMNFDQVVSTSVYLDDLRELAEFDQVYVQYFGPVSPARITIQQLAPVERKTDGEDHYPDLEQVSLIAIRSNGGP
ncbi:MAG: RidA family protein [Acidobacteria bacterium]|nr:RidA family protein [Acidobacteriota bacterium]